VTAVHIVVPDGIDDPARPSGGNSYDRHICRELGSLGWSVQEHPVPGGWPRPDANALAHLAGVMGRIPDGGVALLDGLIASTAPEVLIPQAGRLRLVVLVHMPLGDRREHDVLRAATAVVTTSQWSRGRLLALYGLTPDRVRVAEPGVDRADLAVGTAAGGALLCVSTVAFEKGHDLLIQALESIADLSFQCLCVGRLDHDPAFVENLRRRAADGGLGERVTFAGPRTGRDLERSYAAADLMVLASRAETYGMVVTEALARGLPVIAADVGGVTEALGHTTDGVRPGLLVAPDDRSALAAALRSWLGDAELRRRLRQAARERRESLSGWSRPAAVLDGVLAEASR
jgi:glycosyltransferase involved in cell wall biosynthesis